MAVPKKKKSRARRDRRRAQHSRIEVRAMTTCPTCGSPMIPHRACATCGQYKGRQVIEVEEEGGTEAEK